MSVLLFERQMTSRSSVYVAQVQGCVFMSGFFSVIPCVKLTDL